MERRSFFTYALDEVLAVFEAARGRRSFKLSALPHLTPEELGRLIPAINDATGVTSDGTDFVVLRDGKTEVLFGIGSKEEDVWLRMDGRASVSEIADSLATQWNESAKTAFGRTRKVFLLLVRKGICLPHNPLS
jgi:hypothetical protein